MKADCMMRSQCVDGHRNWGSGRLGTARKTKTARRLPIAVT